mgnify:CR=1 FL=1
MSKVLVTGGGGFLGGAVCHELARRGIPMVLLARGEIAGCGRECKVVRGDLLQPAQVATALAAEEYDTVIDCAAIIPGKSRADSSEMAEFHANIAMTQNLLSALNGKALKSLVKVSTMDVYGFRQGDVCSREEQLPTPSTGYGLAKYCTELLCKDACKIMRVPLAIMRCTQLYGPGDTSSKFIPSAIKAARSGCEVNIYGDGADKRDYVFVNDAAQVIIGAAVECWNGVFNTATGTSTAVIDVLGMVRQICPHPFPVRFQERQKVSCDIQVSVARLTMMAPTFRPTPLLRGLALTYEGL